MKVTNKYYQGICVGDGVIVIDGSDSTDTEGVGVGVTEIVGAAGGSLPPGSSTGALIAFWSACGGVKFSPAEVESAPSFFLD